MSGEPGKAPLFNVNRETIILTLLTSRRKSVLLRPEQAGGHCLHHCLPGFRSAAPVADNVRDLTLGICA